MLTQRGEGAQVAPRTPSVDKPRTTSEDENKAIVHSDATCPVCHVSRTFTRPLRVLRDTLIVVLALAVFVLACIIAGALADHLHPLTACIVGGVVAVGALFAFAWRES